MSRFHVIIPARLTSQRLPNKPLADLYGQPMIVRVWQRAETAGAASVHVATDDARIAEVVEAVGGNIVMTSSNHDSGTSRLAEAVDSLGFDDQDCVVNLQGDEPLMPPVCIQQVAGLLEQHESALIATLWDWIDDESEWLNPNVVKVVPDAAGRAMLFSRAPVPAVCSGSGWPEGLARRHVGLYAYRAGALKRWSSLPHSRLAELESLEQLRALEAGWHIVCARACESIPAGIDTVEDLNAARALFSNRDP